MPSMEERWAESKRQHALYGWDDGSVTTYTMDAAVLAFGLETFDLAQQARDDCSPGWSRFGPARKPRCVHYVGGKRVCAVAQVRARLVALAGKEEGDAAQNTN